MMSSGTGLEEANMMMCCASCGIAEVDDIKLKKCTACKLVRYCSVKCQKAHRPQHKGACKKRAAELRDERLFQQPENGDLGDCPICLLPHSLDFKKSTIQSCCYKLICNGCAYASMLHEAEGSLEDVCPFCRQPYPESEQEVDRNVMRRVEANDPLAMRQMGVKCYSQGKYSSSIEYFMKGAKLGDAEAHYQLALSYIRGEGIEKDMKKAVHHWEEAAIGGHTAARFNLGISEMERGRTERAVQHFIIATNLGCDHSMKQLKEAYAKGTVRKEDFAAALRAHQAAVDATKSPQREAAEIAEQNQESGAYRTEGEVWWC